MGPSSDTGPTAPINVLIVDDHPENRVALGAILGSSEFRIFEAASGAAALRLLLDEEFAVLLVDVVMPEMNGFEFAATVKQRDRTARVPIIFLTAEATDVGFAFRGYRVGAVDFLVKPLDPEVVRGKVAVFAELFRQRKRIERQALLLVQAERREGELRLRELRLASERRYRNLAEAVPHVVWTSRLDGTVDYLNRRWFEYTGRSTAQTDDGWYSAVHPDDLPRCRELWSEARRFDEPCDFEVRLRSFTESYRWHLARVVPERDADGNVVSWLGTFTDITDQKQAALERELLYRRALDSLRARDEFLSIASHELKTPLSSLRLQIEMLQRKSRTGTLSTHQWTEKLEVAMRQIDRLSHLIGQLMDVSRVAYGRLPLEIEDVDLALVVRDVVTRFAEDSARAHSEISIVTQEETVMGKWDRLRVEQVVTNLLSNALKFGAGRPIEITVTKTNGTGHLTVRDHGIGIAPGDVDRIFERFERAVSARAFGGLGLGLFIVRQIVERHGGRVGVDSQPGDGSTFTIDLPLTPPRIEREMQQRAPGEMIEDLRS